MSLYYTKTAIVCLVLILQWNGVILGSAPYFPIEISRTAQSHPVNLWAFPLGVSLLPLLMMAAGEWQDKYILSIVGLMILAMFDDVRYLALHQIGVTIMGIGALSSIVTASDWKNRLVLLVCAGGLYVCRIIMKVLMMWIEVGVLDFSKIFSASIQIMYRGSVACVHPQYTLPVFRVCGLMQWLVFYLVLCAIE